MDNRIVIYGLLALAALGAASGGASAAPINTSGSFTVEGVMSGGAKITTLKRAYQLLGGIIPAGATVAESDPVLNFMQSDEAPGWHFPESAQSFPSSGPAFDGSFAFHVTAMIDVPTAGVWSLGVRADDGFRLAVNGQVMKCSHLCEPGDMIRPFTFDQPGAYALDLTYFQQAGNAELELFASPGRYRTWKSGGANWHLIGDPMGDIQVGTPAPTPGVGDPPTVGNPPPVGDPPVVGGTPGIGGTPGVGNPPSVGDPSGAGVPPTVGGAPGAGDPTSTPEPTGFAIAAIAGAALLARRRASR